MYYILYVIFLVILKLITVFLFAFFNNNIYYGFCARNKVIRIFSYLFPARQCRHLEVLELCGVAEVDRRIARHMCGVGLECLQALDFTHTPVTPDAVRHFSGRSPYIAHQFIL